MDKKETLIKARALIADPAHWTTGDFARRALSGYSVDIHSPSAKCFCALGALARVRGPNNGGIFEGPAYPNLSAAARQLFNRSIPYVNDHLGHDAVLKMFDKAIESC
jgi:hypothetical protein